MLTADTVKSFFPFFHSRVTHCYFGSREFDLTLVLDVKVLLLKHCKGNGVFRAAHTSASVAG